MPDFIQVLQKVKLQKSFMGQNFCPLHPSDQNIKVIKTHPMEVIIISTEAEPRFKKGSAIKIQTYSQQKLVLSRKT